MMFYKETNFKETPIRRIPENWEVVRLGDKNYFEILKSGIKKFGGKKLYLSTKCIENNKIVKIEAEVTFSRRPSRANMEPTLNSVWFAKMKNTVKVYSFTRENLEEINKYILSTGFCGIKCNEAVYPNYLKQFFLSHFFNKIKNSLATGSTQQDIKQDAISKIEVLLPSLPEQQKIVEILSTVDEAIQKVDEVIANTQRLKNGLMQKLLTKGIGHKEFKDTEIGRIPKEWEVVKLGDIAKLESGGTPSRQKPEYWNGTIPWFKSGELNDGEIYGAEEKITELGLKKSSAKIFPSGTLLIALYGRGTVSKTAILGIDATTNQAAGAIIPKNTSFHPKYVQYCLIFLRNKLLGQLVYPSSDVGRTNIYLNTLKLFKIPLPKKIEEQQEIAEILSTVDKKLKLERNEKVKLERIKRRMMGLLLTGKIRIKVD